MSDLAAVVNGLAAIIATYVVVHCLNRKPKSSKRPEEPLFIIRASRPLCPFYGFSNFGGVMLDSEGNQCVLVDGFSPCGYAVRAEPPRWPCDLIGDKKKCDTLVASVPSSLLVYPNELNAESAESRGLPFPQWADAVINRTK